MDSVSIHLSYLCFKTFKPEKTPCRGTSSKKTHTKQTDILLMAEILHHLTCIKTPINNGTNYHIKLVSRISESSTVPPHFFPVFPGFFRESCLFPFCFFYQGMVDPVDGMMEPWNCCSWDPVGENRRAKW